MADPRSRSGGAASDTPPSPSLERSRCAFLSANSELTGFSSPGAALLQTVRELTENARDAGASQVIVRVELLPLGEPLDYGGSAARGGVSAGGAAAQPRREASLALLRQQPLPSVRGWRVTVEDDGCGLPAASLEMLLGSVFCSSKAGYTPLASEGASIGRFGVGLKAALLHALSSACNVGAGIRTPATVATTCRSEAVVRSCRFGLDTRTDAPIVEDASTAPKEQPEASGTCIVMGEAAKPGRRPLSFAPFQPWGLRCVWPAQPPPHFCPSPSYIHALYRLRRGHVSRSACLDRLLHTHGCTASAAPPRHRGASVRASGLE